LIVVDTSVWVAALRAAEGPEAATLRQLLDDDLVSLAAPVRVEILAGATVGERRRLRLLLSALPVYEPTAATWVQIDHWLDKAGAAGESFGFADLLIGALAAEHACLLWSLDSDFRRMARLGMIELFEP
jgi:predicted nucleic acid-binding protein